jgi:hypothetical protein
MIVVKLVIDYFSWYACLADSTVTHKDHHERSKLSIVYCMALTHIYNFKLLINSCIIRIYKSMFVESHDSLMKKGRRRFIFLETLIYHLNAEIISKIIKSRQQNKFQFSMHAIKYNLRSKNQITSIIKINVLSD